MTHANFDQLITAIEQTGQTPMIIDTAEDEPRWIIVKHGRYSMALNIQSGSRSHLCVDAHAHVDGQDAKVGSFAMDLGHQWKMGIHRRNMPMPGTSHGWPAASMVALLVGAQRVNDGNPSTGPGRADDPAREAIVPE